MAITIRGTGIVTSNDFKNVVWTGRTKNGKAVTITLNNAINKSNIDLSMVEKDDTVATLSFEGAYDNNDYMAATTGDFQEPWTITYAGTASDAANGTILLGAGIVSIAGKDVALTRGGSQFTVEREYREINADGDRGTVKERVVIDAARATLTLNALTWITHMTDIYPAIATST